LGQAFGETYKIAFIDTGFCPTQLPTSNTLKYFAQDLENVVCEVKDPRAWHGQEVLKSFLDKIALSRGDRLHLYLYSVFNKRGEQDLALWQRTLNAIEKENIYFAIMALGLPLEAASALTLPKKGIFFVSAGQVGAGIDINSKLWPHELSNDRIHLVGAWQQNIKGEYYRDPLHLYQSKLKFAQIIPAPRVEDKLAHTSLALALFAKNAWALCRLDIECLKKKLKPYQEFFVSE
jgi:hypothetical protein